ncbi:Very-long-chain 3-oxoacyl-CoA reductase-A [Halotydeus destructor]|nr:Very-long-chain 3-oxoacyl-CoA reductase-A [Halotydeus destructor]
MGCACYEWVGLVATWAAVVWVLSKVAKGIWTCWAANALGFGYKWRPGANSWAVITGSTDGIGLEYAYEMGKKGYSLLLISRSADKLSNTKDLIKAKSPKCSEIKTLAVDFSNLDIYEQIEREVKGLSGPVDVLINNVGISYSTCEYFSKLDVTNPPNFVDTLINVNIVSCTKMIKIVLPIMEEAKHGLVINISSFSAAYPTPLLTIYGASKTYVDFLSQALSMEYGSKGIVFQSVLPAYVATKMSKIKKTSLLVPSPSAYVKAALKTAGVETRTYGYWSHKLQGFVTDYILVGLFGVEFYLKKFVIPTLKKINAAYYRKYVDTKTK